MIYLFTNITDSSSHPHRIYVAGIPGRQTINIDPGETIDLELLSTRNQICESLHIKSLVLQGKATVDTLGTEPGSCGRIFVDAKLSSGSITIEDVTIEEPLLISGDVDGTETPISAVTKAGDTYLDVNPLLPDTPIIANIDINTANVEQSYPLPIDSKRFLIKVREGDAGMKVSFTSGGNYITVPCGSILTEQDVDAGSVTLYFKTNKAPRTIEVLSWSV